MSFIVKKTTIPNFMDLLAPHSCRGCGKLGEPICDCCKINILKQNNNICPNCKAKINNQTCPKCHNLPPIYYVGARSGLLDEIIHEYKYDSVRAFKKPLAEMLSSRLPLFPKDTIIVPLPTIPSHIRERGLDHTYLIAKHLSKSRHLKVERILLRNTNSVQVGADRHTRLMQAKTAYAINSKITINSETTYLLLDDIWTTGASMKAAIKLLRDAGAQKIAVAVLAISDFKD